MKHEGSTLVKCTFLTFILVIVLVKACFIICNLPCPKNVVIAQCYFFLVIR